MLETVTIDRTVVVVARHTKVRGHEGLALVRLQPVPAWLEHDVVLVAEVVGLLEAFCIHRLDGLEIVVAEVLDEPAAVLEVRGRRGEPNRVIPLLPKQLGQAPGRDAAWFRLGDLTYQVRVYSAVNSRYSFRGVRQDRVCVFGHEALFRELLQVGRGV